MANDEAQLGEWTYTWALAVREVLAAGQTSMCCDETCNRRAEWYWLGDVHRRQSATVECWRLETVAEGSVDIETLPDGRCPRVHPVGLEIVRESLAVVAVDDEDGTLVVWLEKFP